GRRTVCRRLRDPAERRGLVLLARRLELGISVRRDGAHAEGLRRGDHDQQRQRRPADRRDPVARRGRVQLGYARQSDSAVKWASLKARPYEGLEKLVTAS